jgi:dephospho-CoA kinase
MKKMRLVFGICGNIACGKTYASKILGEIAIRQKHLYNRIDVDGIRRYILSESLLEKHIAVRRKLIRSLNLDIINKPYTINGSLLGNVIFSSPEKMDLYRKIVNGEIAKQLKEKIYNLEDIVAVEWATLLHDQLLPLVNHNILLVTCSKDEQKRRLINPDIPQDQLKQRLNFQKSVNRKMRYLKEFSTNPDKLIIFDTGNNPPESAYEDIFDKIMSQFYYE